MKDPTARICKILRTKTVSRRWRGQDKLDWLSILSGIQAFHQSLDSWLAASNCIFASQQRCFSADWKTLNGHSPWASGTQAIGPSPIFRPRLNLHRYLRYPNASTCINKKCTHENAHWYHVDFIGFHLLERILCIVACPGNVPIAKLLTSWLPDFWDIHSVFRPFGVSVQGLPSQLWQVSQALRRLLPQASTSTVCHRAFLLCHSAKAMEGH